MERVHRIACGLFAAIGVALNAFGAHGLKDRFSEQQMEWFKTGGSYHLWVAAFLFALALAGPPGKRWFWTMFSGGIVFAGSLYLLALSQIRTFGAITPIGGALIIFSFLGFAFNPGVQERSASEQDRPDGPATKQG